MPPATLALSSFLLHTHSLRCGLEEYRQLCWLSSLVLSSAFVQAGIGLAIGIPATILGGRLMASQLFGIKTHDPMVLSATTAVLALAAFVAAVIPARRAAKTEPMTALRAE